MADNEYEPKRVPIARITRLQQIVLDCIGIVGRFLVILPTVFTVLLFLAMFIFGIVYFYDPIVDSLEKRVAVYPVYCAKKVLATHGCAEDDIRAAKVTKYIVHMDQQVVVGLTDGAPEPRKLFNCVVADSKNWSCTLDPDKDSTRAVMRDGEFFNNPPSPWLSDGRYTSRWHYLFAKYLNNE